MIGPRERIPEARWREKLTPPRPLVALDGALYGPPPRPGGAASLAWLSDHDPDAALADALRRARIDGASALRAGGPPGNYLVSGVDGPAAAWLSARGFRPSGTHLDLRVDTRGVTPDPRVRQAAANEASRAWISASFGDAWSDEALRAAQHAGLFVVHGASGLEGFVAVCGNNADAGTFGPLGVAPGARGMGLGAALARTALHALASRGFPEVTVPWVAPETARFYAGVVKVLESVTLHSLVHPLQ